MARFVGLSINKGKQGGGGTITKTDPFTRASGITTDSNNNVTAVTLGDNSYSSITYNSDGLITEYTESIGGVDKIWELTYDSNNLVSTIFEQLPPQPPGQALFTNPGTYSWTCPGGHTSVSAICVGAGGGGGGALAWKNNIPVTPGQSYTVVVGAPGLGGGAGIEGTSGGDSSFNWVSWSMTAQGGKGTATDSNKGGRLGDYDGGGNGGNAGIYGYNGGGAGGYNGTGGTAPVGTGDESAQAGSGGGGGGSWAYYAGGGVGIYGATGQTGGDVSGDGQGGSGGQNGKGSGADGQNSETGGDYGGGYSSRWSGNKGGRGAVRIMWGGGRSFPSNAGDV
tara:strand:+ start:978 stop:1988 length:1011 start_codon:yes stop_codon:yes gene_type:complete